MYRILLIEDDDALAREITGRLEQYGFQVVRSEEYERVTERFARESIHLVILDVNLPRSDGFQVCRRIREISAVPILFASARDGSMDAVMGLSVGGDDYITKPFSSEVLVAKVQAMLRRAYELGPAASDLVEHDGIILDVRASTVRVGDRSRELTKNEFRVLHALLRNHGAVVSRDQLMEALWQGDVFVDDNTLSVNVNRVRKVLAELGRGDAIVTRKGQGYMIP